MKFSLATGVAVFLFLPLMMSGCVAGNKGSAAGAPVAVATTSPKVPEVMGRYVAVVSVEGSLPSGSRIGGVDITLNLPPGVSVQTGKDGQILPEVVTPSGGATGSLSVAKFTPAKGTMPAQLRLAAIKVEGFDPGAVAIVNFEVAGAIPRGDDFSTAALLVIDEKGKPLPGFKASLNLTSK